MLTSMDIREAAEAAAEIFAERNWKYASSDDSFRFVPDADYLEKSITRLFTECLPDGELLCGRLAVTPHTIKIQLAGYTWKGLIK